MQLHRRPSAVIGATEAAWVRPTAMELLRWSRQRPRGSVASLGHELTRAVGGPVHRELLLGAGRQVALRVGRAAGVAALLDGGVAAVEAGIALRHDEVTGRQALQRVVSEATSGALAAFLGVAATAAATMASGGLSGPAAFALGATVASATKRVLVGLWGAP